MGSNNIQHAISVGEIQVVSIGIAQGSMGSTTMATFAILICAFSATTRGNDASGRSTGTLTQSFVKCIPPKILFEFLNSLTNLSDRIDCTLLFYSPPLLLIPGFNSRLLPIKDLD